MVMCFAPECKHYSEKHGCRFFLLPKEPEEAKKWLQLLGRDDKEPTKYSLVCSCHFVGGERKNMPTILHTKDSANYRPPTPEEKTPRWRMHRGESANGFSTGEEDSRGPPDQICCLVDDTVRCQRQAGNASYSKRIQKIVTQRHLKLHLDQNARHIYICDHHKGMIQSARAKRRRKDSEEDSTEGGDVEYPEIDLGQLQINTLRRYKRHFKVPARPGLNKPQLSEVLQKHFKSLPVSEKDIVSNFYKMVSRLLRENPRYSLGRIEGEDLKALNCSKGFWSKKNITRSQLSSIDLYTLLLPPTLQMTLRDFGKIFE